MTEKQKDAKGNVNFELIYNFTHCPDYMRVIIEDEMK